MRPGRWRSGSGRGPTSQCVLQTRPALALRRTPCDCRRGAQRRQVVHPRQQPAAAHLQELQRARDLVRRANRCRVPCARLLGALSQPHHPVVAGCRYADRLEGPWLPHPLNPVRAGVQGSRMAGRPVVADGKLYRFAQDCTCTYGHRVRHRRAAGAGGAQGSAASSLGARPANRHGQPSCLRRAAGPPPHAGSVHHGAPACFEGRACVRQVRTFHVTALNATHFEERETRLAFDPRSGRHGSTAWNSKRYHHLDAHQLPDGEHYAYPCLEDVRSQRACLGIAAAAASGGPFGGALLLWPVRAVESQARGGWL